VLAIVVVATAVAVLGPGGGHDRNGAVAAGTVPGASGATTTAPAGPAASPASGGDVPEVARPARPPGAPVLAQVPPSPPVSVDIPSVGISSQLQQLAMGPDGKLGAPTDFATAGWFAAGPQPGQPGPAVIAGHVDSRSGPAIFYHLRDLHVGAEVQVHRQDGSTVRFAVTGMEQYPKDAFPADKVYGPVPGPELRLITCDGAFDRAAHSYRDNLVVYARAV
jgi:hypothetical protein